MLLGVYYILPGLDACSCSELVLLVVGLTWGELLVASLSFLFSCKHESTHIHKLTPTHVFSTIGIQQQICFSKVASANLCFVSLDVCQQQSTRTSCYQKLTPREPPPPKKSLKMKKRPHEDALPLFSISKMCSRHLSLKSTSSQSSEESQTIEAQHVVACHTLQDYLRHLRLILSQ